MKPGKKICEMFKGIRADIAAANEIDYHPTPCNHEGDCSGTCPMCDSEVRWLEHQLRVRQSLGKAVTIVGLSLAAVPSLSSCVSCGSGNDVDGYLVEPDDTIEQVVPGEVAVDSMGEPIVCDTTTVK